MTVSTLDIFKGANLEGNERELYIPMNRAAIDNAPGYRLVDYEVWQV
jgi:hypothetical protein